MPIVSLGLDASGVRGGAAEASRALNTVSRSTEQAEKHADRLSKALKTAAQSALAFVGAYQAMSKISDFVQSGIEYNKTLEDSKLGIASVIAMTQTLVDRQGNLIEGAEKFAAAQKMSVDMAKALDVASMKSTAGYTDLLTAFQTTLSSSSNLGLSWQENLDIIIDMSNVLSSLGVPMERLAKETETIFSDKGTSQSYVAQRLKLDADTLKSWGQGKEFLENFNKQFGQMKYAGESAASTFTAVKAYYDDVMDSVAAETTRGVFDNLKVAMLSVAGAFFAINEETEQFQVTDKMKGLLEFLQDIGSWTSEAFANSIASMMSGLETLSGLIENNRDALSDFGDAFGTATKLLLAWVAAKKLGVTALFEFARTRVTTTAAGAAALKITAAQAAMDHEAAKASLVAATAERQRILSSTSVNVSTAGRTAAAQMLVQADNQVAAAQLRVAQTANVMNAAQQKATASAGALTAAQTGFASLRASATSLVNLLGGIPGILATAAVFGVGYLMSAQKEAIPVSEKYAEAWSNVQDELRGLPSVARDASAAFKELSETQKKAKLTEIAVDMAEANKKIAQSFTSAFDKSFDGQMANIISGMTGATQTSGVDEAKERILGHIQAMKEGTMTVKQVIEESDKEFAKLGLTMSDAFVEGVKEMATLSQALEILKGLFQGVGDTAEVAGAKIAGMFNAKQMQGLDQAISDTQFKIDQLGRTAAVQAVYDAARKEGIDTTKITYNKDEGGFSVGAGGSAEDAKKLNTLLGLQGELITGTASKKGAAKSVKDLSEAYRDAVDSSRDLRVSIAELEFSLGKGSMSSMDLATMKINAQFEADLDALNKKIKDASSTKGGEVTVKELMAQKDLLKVKRDLLLEDEKRKNLLNELQDEISYYDKIGNAAGKYDAQLRRINAELEASVGWKRLLLLEEERQVKARATGDIGGLMQTGFQKESMKAWEDYADFFEKKVPGAFSSSADAFGDFVGKVGSGTVSMKDAWKSFGQTISQTVAQMASDYTSALIRMMLFGQQAQQSMAGAFGGGGNSGWGGLIGGLVGGIAGMFSGGSSFSSGIDFMGGSGGSGYSLGGSLGSISAYSAFHGGGVVGSTPSLYRSISAAAFNSAPRYHEGGVAGLRPREVPAVLERGEGVFTPEQAKMLTPVSSIKGMLKGMTPQQIVNVYVHNNAEAQVTTKESQDEQGNVKIDIMINQIDAKLAQKTLSGRSAFANAIERRNSLNPASSAFHR